MVELAWLWQRYQPGAAQVVWFRERVGKTGRRLRKVMVVALARKLLIALWRYATDGVARGRCYEACDRAVSRTPGRTAAEPGCPRERRRCPAWRFATVYTEWCRSPGALRSCMRNSGWDHHPTGGEVGRGCPAGESTLGLCRTKLLTEKPSCEAGHKIAPDQRAKPSQILCNAGAIHTGRSFGRRRTGRRDSCAARGRASARAPPRRTARTRAAPLGL